MGLNSQKGISLVMTFLVMTIVTAIIVSMSIILFSEVSMIRTIGNSVISFYAADSGAEKTLYLDNKAISEGSARGFCNICNACDSISCSNCSKVSLAKDGSNGCDLANCANCQITYNSSFDDKAYEVRATVTPDKLDPSTSILYIYAKGLYNDIMRVVELSSKK